MKPKQLASLSNSTQTVLKLLVVRCCDGGMHSCAHVYMCMQERGHELKYICRLSRKPLVNVYLAQYNPLIYQDLYDKYVCARMYNGHCHTVMYVCLRQSLDGKL